MDNRNRALSLYLVPRSSNKKTTLFMIRKWKLKAIIQKIISYLPYKHRINYFFQKYVTKGVILNDDHFELKLTHAKDHLEYLMKYKGREAMYTAICLELGSGWHPVIPVAFYLAGAKKMVSVDISPWMTSKSAVQTMGKFIEWRKRDLLGKYLQHIDEERWNTLCRIVEEASEHDLKSICEHLHL